MRTFFTPVTLLTGGVLLTVGLASCSSDSRSGSTGSTSSSNVAAPVTATTTATTTGSGAPTPSTVEVHDAWVGATDKDMTAVFGTIHNHSASDVHLVSATSPLTGTVELHETVPSRWPMTMQVAADGFRIPAGGELELKPGGHHIMLMALSTPITTGQQVPITVRSADGREVTVTATARSFAGGKEDYQDGSSGALSSAQSSSSAPASGDGATHPHG